MTHLNNHQHTKVIQNCHIFLLLLLPLLQEDSENKRVFSPILSDDPLVRLVEKSVSVATECCVGEIVEGVDVGEGTENKCNRLQMYSIKVLKIQSNQQNRSK